MQRAVPRRRGLILLVGTLLVLAGTAWSATPRTHSKAPHATPKARSHAAVAVAKAPKSVTRHTTPAAKTVQSNPLAGTAGMRIFKDPQNGETGPPTLENAAIINSESADPIDVRNIPQVRLPNGGWELLIDGRIEDAAVMQIDANGNRVMRCVNDPKAALQQAPAPQREDR